MPGGRVLLTRVVNDRCSDHNVLSACSSKARQAHASDTRLFGLSWIRWSTTSCINSPISIIGCDIGGSGARSAAGAEPCNNPTTDSEGGTVYPYSTLPTRTSISLSQPLTGRHVDSSSIFKALAIGGVLSRTRRWGQALWPIGSQGHGPWAAYFSDLS